MRLSGTISAVLACIAIAACSRTADNSGTANPNRQGRTNMQPPDTSNPGIHGAMSEAGAYRTAPEQSPATQSGADQAWDGGASSGVPPTEYESPPGGIAPSRESPSRENQEKP